MNKIVIREVVSGHFVSAFTEKQLSFNSSQSEAMDFRNYSTAKQNVNILQERYNLSLQVVHIKEVKEIKEEVIYE